MPKKIVLIMGALVSLTACRDGSLSQIGGYYQGEMVRGLQTLQVTTQIPSLSDLSDDKIVGIEITPTLATANPHAIGLRYDDDTLFIVSDITSNHEVPLKLDSDKNCAFGNSSVSVELCWNTSRLSLKYFDSKSKNVLSAFYLGKDDGLLPPPGKERTASLYTLDELLGRAKFLNYSVSQEAERVYQAKKEVTVALGNLLPHFNTRDALAYASGGPLGLVETVGDLLPFLFPSNWFKWIETGFLADAERKSFASLRGNEMNAVENLFYLVHRDQNIFSVLENHIDWLKKIYNAILVKEQNAGLPKGSADIFTTVIVELSQDLEQLRFLLAQQYGAIAHAVALPPINGISGLASVNLPDLSATNSIQAKDIYVEGQAKSYEIAAVENLIRAARNSTKERAFGFLDPSSSRSIGFGYPALIQVGKSQETELRKRRDEFFSLIEKRSIEVAADYNSSLRAFNLGSSGLRSSQSYMKLLLRELQTGEELLDRPEFLNLIIETSRKVLRFRSNLISSQYSFMIAKSKLDRLTLNGYYQNLEAGIPRIINEKR